MANPDREPGFSPQERTVAGLGPDPRALVATAEEISSVMNPRNEVENPMLQLGAIRQNLQNLELAGTPLGEAIEKLVASLDPTNTEYLPENNPKYTSKRLRLLTTLTEEGAAEEDRGGAEGAITEGMAAARTTRSVRVKITIQLKAPQDTAMPRCDLIVLDGDRQRKSINGLTLEAAQVRLADRTGFIAQALAPTKAETHEKARSLFLRRFGRDIHFSDDWGVAHDLVELTSRGYKLHELPRNREKLRALNAPSFGPDKKPAQPAQVPKYLRETDEDVREACLAAMDLSVMSIYSEDELITSVRCLLQGNLDSACLALTNKRHLAEEKTQGVRAALELLSLILKEAMADADWGKIAQRQEKIELTLMSWLLCSMRFGTKFGDVTVTNGRQFVLVVLINDTEDEEERYVYYEELAGDSSE